MDVVVRVHGEKRPVDRPEDVDDAADWIEVLIDDGGADGRSVLVRGSEDEQSLGDSFDRSGPLHQSRSAPT